MDLIELLSVTAGSVIILAIIGSIALEGIKQQKMRGKIDGKNNALKTISAIDANWNKVKVPVKAD
jgi:hypothetical protein